MGLNKGLGFSLREMGTPKRGPWWIVSEASSRETLRPMRLISTAESTCPATIDEEGQIYQLLGPESPYIGST